VVCVVVEDEVHVVLEGAELDLHFGRVVHLVVLGDERLEERFIIVLRKLHRQSGGDGDEREGNENSLHVCR